MILQNLNSFSNRFSLQKYSITWLLLGLNIILWVLMEINGGSGNPNTLIKFGAKHGILITKGEYWRLLTPIFLHIGFYHLFTNSVGLIIFGRYVEILFGKKIYLTIYIFSGMWGNVASYFASPAIGAGASGALFGIIGAYASYLLLNRKTLGDYGKQTLTGIILIIFINLVFGFTIEGVDNIAHAGGLLSGMIFGWILAPKLTILISRIPSEIPTHIEQNIITPRSNSTWYLLTIISIILIIIGANWIGDTYYIRILNN